MLVCAAAGPPNQVDWTANTLEDGFYTCGSNVHQIGVMLSKYLEPNSSSSEDMEFVSLLQSKVSADVALQHAWLL